MTAAAPVLPCQTLAAHAEARLRAPRTRLLAGVLAQKRLQHPALRIPATLETLEEVCQREDILLRYGLSLELGFIIHILGGTCITLSDRLTTDRTRAAVLAHELGHAWLHIADPIVTRWRGEEISNRQAHAATRGEYYYPCAGAGPLFDRCEDEADIVAAGLLFPDQAFGHGTTTIEVVRRTLQERVWAADREIPNEVPSNHRVTPWWSADQLGEMD